ncbi:MAG: aldehyde dehydrogenase family protein [Microbacteriaceae bacterium]
MTEHPLNLLAPTGALPIADGWREVTGSLDIVFPYDESVIGTGPLASIADAEAALDAAERSLPEAAALTTEQRKSILLALTERVREATERLEHLLVLETGKPLVDCRTEVNRTIVTLQATAEEASRIHGETVPLDVQELGRGMIGYYTRKPAGIVVGIAGFNYPLLLATHKLAPAIAAGCPVIVKPAPHTPLATLELMAMAREVLSDHGVSGSLVQLISGDAQVGERLVTDPRAQVVSFTGSAAIGHLIAKQAAPRKTLLELGSNTGFIVAQDADLEAAARTVAVGGFYANGQACIAVQRIVVEREVAAEFTHLVAEHVREIVVGDPRDERTRVAPVINAASGNRIRAAVAAAVAAGATLVVDGTASDNPALIGPTVVSGVARNAELWAEEIFGPVVAITVVDSIAEAIEVVNDSRYGLQAAIFTASLESAFTAIEQLDVGGVVVNEMPGFRSDIMPYGGVKDSGIGREGPRYAVEEYTVTRMAMIRPTARR